MFRPQAVRYGGDANALPPRSVVPEAQAVIATFPDARGGASTRSTQARNTLPCMAPS